MATVSGWKPAAPPTPPAVVERWSDANGGGVSFQCPGCGFGHSLPTGAKAIPGDQRWTWDGSMDKPVIAPSVLVRWPSYTEAARARDQAFYNEHGYFPERPADSAGPDWQQNVCHSFVGSNGAAPGQIAFLGDSTHALAGQTVALPPVVA